MQILKPLIFILTALLLPSFTPSASATANLCFLNVTLITDTTYFIEKAFNQWKTEPSEPAYIFCNDGEMSFPTQIILTGRGRAYPLNNNSKIRLSIAMPKTDLSYMFDRSFEVSLNQKQLIVDGNNDYTQLENVEIHIENNIAEDEIRSITKSVLLIKPYPESK